ncbi:MAG: xanthine dehydrogenase family protein molybdopterin-binding subunit [Thaumarchaeota archaeon]|nr:xanthine dehydrogenase family protein molybdopterin-binding subunit [Nitrososphaerota archaeon]
MAQVAVATQKQLVGQRIKRKEDLRLVTGTGRYIDDLNLQNLHHVAILRSPYAHAKIRKIDASRALSLPGVIAVLTGKDIVEMSNPMAVAPPIPISYYSMAVEKVRFVGEPVAAVVARDRYVAEDALELIDVQYDPLPHVLTIEDAIDPKSPLVHDEVKSNFAWKKKLTYGNVDKDFEGSDEVITEKFSVHRVSSAPMETFGVVAHFDKFSKSLLVHSTSQIPGALLAILSGSLKVPQSQIRLVTGDIGGGFGVKLGLPYLILMSVISMKTGVPVKYVEDRRESLLGLQHGSETEYEVQAAVNRDGTVKSLRIEVFENIGAYPAFPEPEGILEQLYCGAYKIGSYALNANVVMSNKCVTGPCRGYGRYNVAFMLERLMDSITKKYGLDPSEVRFKNFIQPNEFPYTAPNGNLYDSGNYSENLRKALEVFGYDAARMEQRRARDDGRLLGIGMAFIIEIGTPNFAHFSLVTDKPPYSLLSNNTEIATVRIETTGKVSVTSGLSPQGQGHETVISQIVGDELGVLYDDVFVDPGFDSSTHPFTGASGTYGSRFAGVGASAAALAARKVREKLLTIAGLMIGEKPDNLDIANGLIFAKNFPAKAIPIHAVAGATYYHSLILPKDLEPNLSATAVYGVSTGTMPDPQGKMNNGLTYASAAHLALVEVDPETGKVKVLRYVAVDDCGKQLNPLLVDGQSHGSIAHALSWAFFEELKYDTEGQLVSSSFIDYLAPTAVDMPDIMVDRIETPSPFTVLGSKGFGEGGSMPVMPVVASAIEVALGFNRSVELRNSHMAPEIIWNLGKKIPTR